MPTVLAVALVALACSQQPGESTAGAPKEPGPLSVYVVNYPLHYFAERIGGRL